MLLLVGQPIECVGVNEVLLCELERMINALSAPQQFVSRAGIVLSQAQAYI